MLAAAADAARREGLPAPIPVSARFPDAPRSEEAYWQERVVDHLGLDDWLRVDVADGELDILGPRARAIIERHGLISPANMVFVENVVERGNTASTTHFVALYEYLEAGRFKKGDEILLLSLASGLEVGIVIFRMDELVDHYGRAH